VGRPREHDERTASSLLAAAEQSVQEHGPEAVTVRGVARDAGTSTRAVYSLFGSKEGLIAALAAQAFDILREGVEAVPTTDRSDADLVEAGLVFRRFAIEHPSLFRLAFPGGPTHSRTAPAVRSAATTALEALKLRIARLDADGALRGCSVAEATLHFDAVCEGLAALELRGSFPLEDGERLWRQGLRAIADGFAGGNASTATAHRAAANRPEAARKRGSR
jgi:AcrR family transcriptional regulator